MAERRAIVLADGRFSELPAGDTVAAAQALPVAAALSVSATLSAAGHAMRTVPIDTSAESVTASLFAADAVPNGTVIAFTKIGVSNANLATVAPAGGDSINGQASLVIEAPGDSIMLVSNGDDGWFIINQYKVPISFLADKNGSDQTGVTNNTNTKVTATTERWDNGGFYDAANSRFIPPRGLYEIKMCLFVSGGTGDGMSTYLSLYKNGSLFKSGPPEQQGGSLNSGNMAAFIVDCDGDDILEFYGVAHFSTTAKTFSGNTQFTWWAGSRL